MNLFDKNTDISLLTASDIAKLTPDNIKNLTKIQQQNFGPEQTSGLTMKLLAVMPFKYVPSDSISSISTNSISLWLVIEAEIDRITGKKT